MMKKSLLTFASLVIVNLAFAQTVTFNPAQPVANKPLQITYDPAGGKLEGKSEISLKVFTFDDKGLNPSENVLLTKEGNVFKGSFTPLNRSALALLSFSSGSLKDENPKGYYTVFYNNDKPVPFAHYWESMLHDGVMFGYVGISIDIDKTKAFKILEKGVNEYPEVRYKHYPLYISWLYAQDQERARNLVLTENKRIDQSANKLETDWSLMSMLYANVKMPKLADSINNLWIAQYPKGHLAYNRASHALGLEQDIVKKEQLFKKIEADFGFTDPTYKEKHRADNVYATMAEAFLRSQDVEKFKEIVNKIDNKLTKAEKLNEFALRAIKSKNYLDASMKFSKQSLEILDQMKDIFSKASSGVDGQQAIKGIERIYAMYADTYAALLEMKGEIAEAVKYLEIAVKSNNYSSGSMNTRYVSNLVKSGQAAKAIEFGERFVKEGFGNDQMKADLKAVYKGSENFDTSYAKWEQIAYDKEVAKYKAEMIDRVAPGFSLKNLEGETVSLASLKGKVVIVDYWATWCGPCIASFPSMQKSVDKYKDDPNVAFVFINTWQNETNREEVVRNFMKANPYRFNVLLDNKIGDDSRAFEVIAQYGVDGIPTKFILDGNGKIRFKKVGFNVDASAGEREMDILITLAKQATINTK